jgi:hypothetical protein
MKEVVSSGYYITANIKHMFATGIGLCIYVVFWWVSADPISIQLCSVEWCDG